jgi:hypothetical protein
MDHIPVRAYVLSPQARATAGKVLAPGEKLLWGGESGALAAALPKILALIGVLFVIWIAYDFVVVSLGFGADSLFGANQSRTPKGVGLVMFLVGGVVAAFMLRWTLTAALAAKRSGRKVTLVTDRRVLSFELTPNAGPAARLATYALDGVRRAEAKTMGSLTQALLLTLEEKDEDGNVLRIWLPIASGAQDGCDVVTALLKRSKPESPPSLNAS